jgi:hypothetical protein
MIIQDPKNTLINNHHASTFKKDDGVITTEMEKVYVLLNAVILCYIFFKLTYFFKISKTYGLQQALLFGVVKAVLPFLAIFFFFILFFAIMSIILGSN